MNVHMPHFNDACTGFTMLEALLASGVLSLGLLGSVQLSQHSLRATEVQRNLDEASSLAQNLAECWGVETALCLQEFAGASLVAPFNTDSSMAFERTWDVKNIPIAGAPSGHLQELRIKVRWMDGVPSQGENSPSEILWIKRRAATTY